MSTMREILERHADSGEKLTLEDFVAERRELSEAELIEERYTLIKGSAASLRFLGELLIRFADGDHGRSFDIHPHGAGSVHFSDATSLGIFLVKKGSE